MGATPFLRDLTYREAPRDLRSLRAVHLGGRADPARAGAGRARAARLRDLGRLGHDRERPRHLQRARRPRGEVVRQRRRAAARHGAARGGRRRARRLAAGVEGDLLVRGPAQFAGYFKRPAVHRGRPHRRRLVQDRRPRDARPRRLPRHHRPDQGRDHPRRREHPGRGGREPALHSSRRSRAWPSWPCPTRGWASGPARWSSPREGAVARRSPRSPRSWSGTSWRARSFRSASSWSPSSR